MKHRPETLLLYIIIEDRLKQNNPITIPQLRKHCIEEFFRIGQKELVVSEEAIAQDLVILKSLFQIPIRKSSLTGGYYLGRDARSFLDIHKSNDPEHFRLMFKYVFGVNPHPSVYYHIETPIYTKGWHKLIPIKQAIQEQRRLLIKYRDENRGVSPIEILPYRVICENLQWYLTGHLFGKNKVSILPLRNILPDIALLEVVPPEELPLDFHLHIDNRDILSE